MVTVQVGDQVWIRKPGNPSTPVEFIAAMEQIKLWKETQPPNDLVRWNPWDYEELDEHNGFDAATWAALEVRDGWRRKGARQQRKPFDVDAWMAEQDAKWKREQLAREKRWAKAARRYDPESHEARLRMLEDWMSLRRVEEELVGFVSGTTFPGMDPARRAKKVLELEEQRAKWQAEIAELAKKVGDPEAVVDERGQMPAERRETNLIMYRFHRARAVPQLRAHLAGLEKQIATAGKPRDHNLEAERSITDRKLQQYLSVPPLMPDDMCADCYSPVMTHGWKLWPEGQHLCPAWPRNRAHLQEVRVLFDRFVNEKREQDKRESRLAADAAGRAEDAAKPKPIATFPRKVPITEVTERLAELQKEHPDAELRSGPKGFELWLPEPTNRK
jgi:hypothetical protein